MVNLEAEKDYTINWSNESSKSVGSYTATVTGKGDYVGTAAKAEYKINPKGTSIVKLKKAKKAVTVKWKKQSAKMSTSRITGYQTQINKKFTKGKKTVTVKGKKKYYVRVRTFTTIKGEKFYSPWSKIKSVKTQ